MNRFILILMSIVLTDFTGVGSAVCDEKKIVQVASFSKGSKIGWEPKKFVNNTVYQLIKFDNATVLEANSNRSASGLVKRIKVNIDKTPFLNWSWNINNQIEGEYNEKEKSGDDYAARIYVVTSGIIPFISTYALNYVWSKHSEKGDIWPSAYAPDNSQMIALRSFEAKTGKWYTEKRDIKKDFKLIFGKDITIVHAVVLMTDTDDTLKKVKAYYGDIFFSAK